MGTGAVEEILRARTELGTFENLEQFLGAVSPRVVNRKALESLIKAGAFDRFAPRQQLLANVDLLQAYAQRLRTKRPQAAKLIYLAATTQPCSVLP